MRVSRAADYHRGALSTFSKRIEIPDDTLTGTIESVTFELGDVKHPTGMERLEMATKMN